MISCFRNDRGARVSLIVELIEQWISVGACKATRMKKKKVWAFLALARRNRSIIASTYTGNQFLPWEILSFVREMRGNRSSSNAPRFSPIIKCVLADDSKSVSVPNLPYRETTVTSFHANSNESQVRLFFFNRR